MNRASSLWAPPRALALTMLLIAPANAAFGVPEGTPGAPGAEEARDLTTEADARSPSATYRVEMAPWDKRLVRIEAALVTREEVLLMYPEGAEHVPEGWATYVRELSAVNESGEAVALESLGNAQWKVPEEMRGRTMRLSYEVLLHHDAGERWPFGWDEAAYVKDDAVFFTGRALFIVALDLQSIEVNFDLPPDWKLLTPWDPGVEPRHYQVTDPIALTESAHLTGDFLHRTVGSEGLAVELGLGESLAPSVPLFEETLNAALAEAIDLFGGAPDQTFVIIANTEREFSGGATFPRSVSMLFQEPPTTQNRPEWSHIFIHELLHLWLGGAIRPAASQEYWFTEGFTDYLAHLVQFRVDLIDEADFWSRVGEHAEKYAQQAGQVSLREAGDEKGKHYDLVYSGGLLAALALDVELRTRSEGAAGLPDLMRQVYEHFGESDRGLTLEHLVELASRLAEADLQAFFDAYVTGPSPLPVQHLVETLGLRRSDDQERRLLVDPQARPAAADLREAVLSAGAAALKHDSSTRPCACRRKNALPHRW